MRFPTSILTGLALLALPLNQASAQRKALSTGRFLEPLSAEFKVTDLPDATQRRVQFCFVNPQPGATARWDFGDGRQSRELSPKHTFALPGTFDVRLTLSNAIESVSGTQAVFIGGVPDGFVDEFLFKTKVMTAGVIVVNEDTFITWSRDGTLWRWDNGAYGASPILDISEEVAVFGDHGLLSVAIDPAFGSNGYIYLYYGVDRYHLDNFGTPGYDPSLSTPQTETTARLTRFSVFDPTDPNTDIDPSSRFVLLGESFADAMPICATSHGVGGLAFAGDGTLLLSLGDSWLGPSFQTECLSANLLNARTNVKSFRAQFPDSPNGKLLRIDPSTGDGDPSNPFFDVQNPGAWSSRVWALGMRNPYSFVIRPHPTGLRGPSSGPGLIYLADVGDSLWEELNVIEHGGMNLGWPIWEGMAKDPFWGIMNTQNLDAPNPLFGTPGCNEPFFRFEDLTIEASLNPGSWPNRCDGSVQIPSTIPRFMHTRPAVAWLHGDQPAAPRVTLPRFDLLGNPLEIDMSSAGSGVAGQSFLGNCVIAGAWLDGGVFPAPYDDVLFNADYGEGWIKAFEFDDAHQLKAVHDFAFPEGRGIMFITKDPQQKALYYLEYQTNARGLYRISFSANALPIADASAAPGYGSGPLRVDLSGLGSIDPEGASLTHRWDFGDGSPLSPLNGWAETVHLFGAEDITDELSVISNHAGGTLLGAGSAFGNGPKLGGRLQVSMPVIHDGLYASAGSASTGSQQVVRAKSPWVGYHMEPARRIAGLIFQEGLNSGTSGGILQARQLEYYDSLSASWKAVTGLQAQRPFPDDPNLNFESFHFSFDPVLTNFIRLRDGRAGPGQRQFSVGELRVLAMPEPSNTQPMGFTAQVTVSDPAGLADVDSVLVSLNNTPPVVVMTSPAEGDTYPVGVPVPFPITAQISDAEHDSSELSCLWQVDLVHDNHTHPEPESSDCGGNLLLLPHGELRGDIIFWRFTLTVTDAAGLSTSVTRDLIPEGDCNLNGIRDSTDIANGSSQDANGNGIPDECE